MMKNAGHKSEDLCHADSVIELIDSLDNLDSLDLMPRRACGVRELAPALKAAAGRTHSISG